MISMQFLLRFNHLRNVHLLFFFDITSKNTDRKIHSPKPTPSNSSIVYNIYANILLLLPVHPVPIYEFNRQLYPTCFQSFPYFQIIFSLIFGPILNKQFSIVRLLTGLRYKQQRIFVFLFFTFTFNL